jgi:hypothetical protein
LESPGKDGKMRCNRMLSAFCAVATGSWPLMIEPCGGRRQRRPRPDLGCSAIGWIDFIVAALLLFTKFESHFLIPRGMIIRKITYCDILGFPW